MATTNNNTGETIMTTINEIKTKLANGIKYMPLNNGEKLFFHYANNAGRGSDNVTITRCAGDVTRTRRSACLSKTCITQTTTGGWAGNVNFSERVFRELF
jgi:hypothetical protein